MLPIAASDDNKNAPPTIARQGMSAEIGTNRNLLLMIAFVAVMTSALYDWHFRNHYFPDSPSYITPAGKLLAGSGFADAEGRPATIVPPGYPLLILPFLAAHLDLEYLIVFQHLLRVMLIMAAALFTLRWTHDSVRALLVGLLLCIDFPLLEAANSVLTEMLFTVIMSVVLWLLWREAAKTLKPGVSCLFAGLLAGAAVLVRPVAILFFAAGALYLLLTRPSFRIRAAAYFVAVSLCLPLFWAYRNYREAGNFTLTSIAGVNAFFYRGAGALAANDPGSFRENFSHRQQELERVSCQDLEQQYHQRCSAIPLSTKAHYYSQRGRQIVFQNPVGYFKSFLRGAAVMMLDGGANTLIGLAGTSWPAGMRLLLAYTLPMLCFAVLGLVLFWKENRNFFWLAFLTIAYFVGISAGPEAYGRFRVPFLPLYAILIATALQRAGKRLRRKAGP